MLKNFSVRLEEEYIDALKRYSKASGFSIQTIMNTLISDRLNHNNNRKPDNPINSDPVTDILFSLQEIL